MEEVSTIGLDLAKHVFQAHGASASGAVVFRTKLRRDQVLSFFAGQPRCRVAMEACASAHHWGRAIGELGHEVQLIAPAYVKPFVKRQKNDVADAEAICEAAQRPTMRFVAVKSEACQAAALVFRARDLLVGQQTQLINALRGHLAEFGVVVAKGAGSRWLPNPGRGGPRRPGAGDRASDPPAPGRDAADPRRAHRRARPRDRPARQGGRNRTAADERSRCRPGDRHRPAGLGASCRDVQVRTGLCRLARAHAAPTLDRGQAKARGRPPREGSEACAGW